MLDAAPRAAEIKAETFNSPGFHEVDVMAFVKRWKANGHLAAVMKDQGAIRAREVLERKANSSTRLAFCTDFPLARKLGFWSSRHFPA